MLKGTVPLTCNVALACTHKLKLACNIISANQMGEASVSQASIHPARNTVNTH